MINRRQFLLSATAAAVASAQTKRPNFVFVLVDDLRFDATGYLNHPMVKTPEIDRIAREGMIFKNMYVTIPLCSPSRGCYLTGRYAHAHGVFRNDNNNELSHKLVTFPKLLRDAGYETAFVGKWHMGTDDTPRPGFDKWVSFKGQGQYNNPALNLDGQQVKPGGYITDLLNQHALDFVKKDHAKPFCLYLGHKAVHGPFEPAERHKALYTDFKIERAPNSADTLEGKPALTRPIEGRAAPGGKGPTDEVIKNQMRCLAAIDEGVGQLYAALEQTRQLDNTLFVFTSDNGYFWGEHGLGDKRWAYEESTRIPMAIRWTGHIKPGSVTEAMALNVDIAPTFLAAAGVAIPKNVHGKSLLPVFAGKLAGWRKSFLTEYYKEPNTPRVPSWQAVQTATHKYVHYTDENGLDEMYDLAADKYEMKNVLADPKYAGTLVKLKAEMERLKQATA